MRSTAAAVCLVLAFSACPTASLPPDGGSTHGDEDAGSMIACPEGFIELPRIDFGCVARGDVRTMPLPTLPGAAFGEFESQQAIGIFSATDAGVHFAPTEERDFIAIAHVFRGPCVIARQRVMGSGVDAVLKWTPALVDFGYANRGTTRTASVTFRHCGFEPVTISQLEIREGTIAASTFAIDAGSLTIPAATRDVISGQIVNAERQLELSFTPAGLGPRQGSLVGATALATQSIVSVQLRGVGGAAIIDVMPTTLAFGVVTMPTTQTVTIRNVGTRPSPADPRANLHLGVDGGPPFFELAPASCGSVMMSTYDPSNGIEVMDSVTLSITLQPAAMPRTCTLHVFSDDPNTPDVEVAITAQ